MKKLAILLLVMSSVGFGDTSYTIEAAANDETFIINGEVFKARTYCLGWSKGDNVIFLEGSPFGACARAVLYNKNRKSTCNVWCE